MFAGVIVAGLDRWLDGDVVGVPLPPGDVLELSEEQQHITGPQGVIFYRADHGQPHSVRIVTPLCNPEVDRSRISSRGSADALERIEDITRELQSDARTLESRRERQAIEAQLREVERQLRRMRSLNEQRKGDEPRADARNI